MTRRFFYWWKVGVSAKNPGMRTVGKAHRRLHFCHKISRVDIRVSGMNLGRAIWDIFRGPRWKDGRTEQVEGSSSETNAQNDHVGRREQHMGKVRISGRLAGERGKDGAGER
jgi:hypothetical protein